LFAKLSLFEEKQDTKFRKFDRANLYNIIYPFLCVH